MTPEQIRDFRVAKGWSQAELATRLGVDQATISRIETGKLVPARPVELLLQGVMAETLVTASERREQVA